MSEVIPQLLYSCDPGYAVSNATGRAEFIQGELVSCGAFAVPAGSFIERFEQIVSWMKHPERLLIVPSFMTTPVIDVFVVELSKIYPGPNQKGDPDDVVLLAALGGMIAGCLPTKKLHMPRPQEWKGNVPKKTMLDRIEGRLTPQERAVLDRGKGKRDAKLDAIGMGLVELGRLGR